MKQSGSNSGIYVTVATVTKAPPALAIRLDGDPFDLEGDELIVVEHLTQHTRNVTINGGPAVMVVNSGLSAGDKVIVLVVQDGQLYYVMDKVV